MDCNAHACSKPITTPRKPPTNKSIHSSCLKIGWIMSSNSSGVIRARRQPRVS